MSKVSRMPRAEQWADRIGTQMGKSVEAIIEVGRLLVKAKADLAHGEWQRMLDDGLLPFSRQTAFRIIAVAENQVLSNVTHVQRLPPSWGTLYELTKVEPARLKAAFKDGLITPDMKRSEVKALLPATKKEEAPDIEVAPIVVRTDAAESDRISAALEPFRELVRDWPEDWTFRLAIYELEELLKHVRRLEARRERIPA